ncbi:MAG: hypothetical protein ACJAT2_002636 [Bacteriovoracaceae bacterium]|jgi:hypothetical protein
MGDQRRLTFGTGPALYIDNWLAPMKEPWSKHMCFSHPILANLSKGAELIPFTHTSKFLKMHKLRPGPSPLF